MINIALGLDHNLANTYQVKKVTMKNGWVIFNIFYFSQDGNISLSGTKAQRHTEQELQDVTSQ